jgi:hypothetical protein
VFDVGSIVPPDTASDPRIFSDDGELTVRETEMKDFCVQLSLMNIVFYLFSPIENVLI